MCIFSRILKKKTGPAIGYRAFDFEPRRGGVRSLYYGETRSWRVAMSTAVDPRLDADYGFHARSTLAGIRAEYPRAIYARVRGSGIVVHHVNGHRASNVRILRFYVRVGPHPRWVANRCLTPAELGRLRRRYPGVPVTILPAPKEGSR